VDITSGIATTVNIHQCRGCQRYLRQHGTWAALELESRELLSMCLKKINGLSKVKVVDAQWIWTEPHSKRLKVKVTVQKEVVNRAILQQSFVVEYVVRNQQCDTCAASYANQSWKSQVQVRQRVAHKRTFLYLEQLILKHNAHHQCLSIETFRDGMDFFFAERNQAAAFISFLDGVVPIKVKKSKKLISADNHSNIFHFKYTNNVEIIPLCKDDLVLLPRPLAKNLSEISQLSLVLRVNSSVALVDPLTCQTADLSVEKYCKNEFKAIMSSNKMIEFIVLSSEPAEANWNPAAPQRKRGGKFRLAEVEVARDSDLGSNDTRFTVITHLGHLLKAGDTVLGYDLGSANVNDDAMESMKDGLPDIILVRKVYNKNRFWEIKQLEVDNVESLRQKDEDMADQDYERFLQEIEADKEMRKQINLYKKQGKISDGDEEGDQESKMSDNMDNEEIRVEDLLDNLQLNNVDADPDEAHVFAPGMQPASNWEGFEPEDKPFGLEKSDEVEFHFK